MQDIKVVLFTFFPKEPSAFNVKLFVYYIKQLRGKVNDRTPDY